MFHYILANHRRGAWPTREPTFIFWESILHVDFFKTLQACCPENVKRQCSVPWASLGEGVTWSQMVFVGVQTQGIWTHQFSIVGCRQPICYCNSCPIQAFVECYEVSHPAFNDLLKTGTQHDRIWSSADSARFPSSVTWRDSCRNFTTTLKEKTDRTCLPLELLIAQVTSTRPFALRMSGPLFRITLPTPWSTFHRKMRPWSTWQWLGSSWGAWL